MCGIVGYVGAKQAAPILLEGLAKLEYRGYDSTGIAVRDGDNKPEIVRAKGRLRKLAEKTDGGRAIPGTCGIGHTRWATHGEPSEINAHPHASDDLNVVGVHNGIIENYQELKNKLERKNYRFHSETDTEVVIKLVDYYYKKYRIGPVDAINKTLVRVRGSYALCLMFAEYPGEIWVARKDSPMIIGEGNGEMFVASDVPAILGHTNRVYYIGNMELGRLTRDHVTFYNLDGDEIQKQSKEIEWDAESAEKGGYEHFMLKEIHEQPKAVRDTIESVVRDGKIDLSGMSLDDDIIRGITSIVITACGSAYHVGVTLQYIFEDLARIPVRVELASEFRYRNPLLTPETLVVAISQSGETADTLAAVREAKDKGARTLAIVNVMGSSIARESDDVFYTLAGPEIAVATTKGYSAQLVAGYLLAIRFGMARGFVSGEQCDRYLQEIASIPAKIERTLEDKERIQWFAAQRSAARDIFLIGRGLDYAICLEGSLKVKEISYSHSEAYAAGELKHGTISLVEDGTLVIGILTQPALLEKTMSNMLETKSRGAYLMGLTTYGNYNVENTANFTVYVPRIDEHFAASLSIIPLQLMAYYISVARGLDVDKPRNLAKSVTVE